MPDADLVTITDRFIAALSAGDWRQLQTLLAPDLRYSKAGDGQQLTGAEAYIEHCQAWKLAFPDGAGTIRLTAAEGATVAQEVLWEGVHQGALSISGRELPPSGHRVAVAATLWYRCDRGRITAIHHHLDRLGLLQQLGAPAAPEQPATDNQTPAC